ncbi:oxidoreductase Fe-S binding subunit [Atlantibacter hermannii]|nr:oxidoreductase Fe-S binding subunit [Atlantibacter hermannii]
MGLSVLKWVNQALTGGGVRGPVAGSEFELPADVLIMAFGFRPHSMPWLQGSGVRCDDDGLIITGGGQRLATQTTCDKVFAGGDAVHGADLVVTAMAAGHQAARDIVTVFERCAEYTAVC